MEASRRAAPVTSPDATRRGAERRPAPSPAAGGDSSHLLTLFGPRHADLITSWVRSRQELTWLAPSTTHPLTAAKVLTWGEGRDHRILFWSGRHDTPSGYAELNKMPGRPHQMWIGHFIVDPAHRGLSYGSCFARALLGCAFQQYAALNVLLVVFPDNTAAIQCYKRAGMTVVGRESKYFDTTGEEHEFLRMSINRDQFRRLVAVGQMPARPLPFHRHSAGDRLHHGAPSRA